MKLSCAGVVLAVVASSPGCKSDSGPVPFDMPMAEAKTAVKKALGEHGVELQSRFSSFIGDPVWAVNLQMETPDDPALKDARSVLAKLGYSADDYKQVLNKAGYGNAVTATYWPQRTTLPFLVLEGEGVSWRLFALKPEIARLVQPGAKTTWGPNLASIRELLQQPPIATLQRVGRWSKVYVAGHVPETDEATLAFEVPGDGYTLRLETQQLDKKPLLLDKPGDALTVHLIYPRVVPIGMVDGRNWQQKLKAKTADPALSDWKAICEKLGLGSSLKLTDFFFGPDGTYADVVGGPEDLDLQVRAINSQSSKELAIIFAPKQAKG